MYDLIAQGKAAKVASVKIAALTDKERANVLLRAATLIRERKDYLMAENAKDVTSAREKGMTDAFIDRLTLSEKVIEGMAVGLEQVADLETPLDKIVYSHENVEQGISIIKKTVPFGVVGIIYESRPNVTADAFALCFKTANAVVLKGGSDSLRSNVAIVNVLKDALKSCGVDDNAVSVIEDTSRETTTAFMRLNKYVDLLIPRGSASLIKAAVENSTIPIIETGTGNCHVYVDEFADEDMAANVIFNAKTQRYSVCNACESIVVHTKKLNSLIKIAKRLEEKQVEIRADERAYEVLKDYPFIARANEEDFYTEYGAAIISIKTVDTLSQAIEHINEHGTRHSESIITENLDSAQKFLDSVDASSVYHNASTRFTDGFVFGLGAEIGISTQTLHARGPMGLSALVTTKYIIKGNGAIRK